MRVNRGIMASTGILLLLTAGLDAALEGGSHATSADVCGTIGQVNTTLSGSPGLPASCTPPNYTLALILALIGVGVLLLALFVRNEPQR